MSLLTIPRRQIDYPETDGQPIAENTLQFRWIVTIEGGLEELFRNDPQVFVAGDLLWYPVKGNNQLRQAPDAMVVFGRPKGDRSAYLQWEEDNIAPQVVFEVLSPGNRHGEMLRKFRFYEKYGVQEYYIYDPQSGEFSAWMADQGILKEVENPIGWTSPLLGCRFELAGVDLQIIRPDGRPFASYLEVCQQREAEARRAEMEARRAEMEAKKVERLKAQLQAAGITPEI